MAASKTPSAKTTESERRAPIHLAKKPSRAKRNAAPRGAGQAKAAPASPLPSPSRLALILGRVIKRRREAIHLTLAQVASMTNISQTQLAGYEAGSKTPYDHAILLARLLGIRLDDLPGLRASSTTPLLAAIEETRRRAGETMRFAYTCERGEKLLGATDTLTGLSEFIVEIDDSSIAGYPRGTMLGFLRERGTPPRLDPGLVVAQHRRSRLTVLRLVRGDVLVGLAKHVPCYQFERDAWDILGHLVLVVFPS